MSEVPHNPENSETKTITLKPEQVKDLEFLLDTALLQKGVYQSYANRLNDMYRQIAGKNSPAWDRYEGKYYPDKQ